MSLTGAVFTVDRFLTKALSLEVTLGWWINLSAALGCIIHALELYSPCWLVDYSTQAAGKCASKRHCKARDVGLVVEK